MSPEEKLDKVFELNAFGSQLFKTGLAARFPEKSEEEIHQLFLQHIAQCYNRNY
jgi:hypothetical protein